MPGLRFLRLYVYSPGMPQLSTWQSAKNHKLTLEEVLDGLVADGLVAADAAKQLIAERRSVRADQHPLVVIAEKKWKSLGSPRRLLHLEALAEWLAGKVGLPYLHIDPLKVDFSAVTGIMSTEYATRFKILPVAVTATEATIATAEPYLTQWARDLAQMLRLEIRLVIANPLDIARFASVFSTSPAR